MLVGALEGVFKGVVGGALMLGFVRRCVDVTVIIQKYKGCIRVI